MKSRIWQLPLLSGMGWNSMTWLATTGSLWSARRSRVWSQEGRRQLRGSAPAGGASPPLLYKWLFSGPFFGRFIKKRPTLTTNHLLFTFHLYKYLSLVSVFGHWYLFNIYCLLKNTSIETKCIFFCSIFQWPLAKFHSKSDIVGCPCRWM